MNEKAKHTGRGSSCLIEVDCERAHECRAFGDEEEVEETEDQLQEKRCSWKRECSKVESGPNSQEKHCWCFHKCCENKIKYEVHKENELQSELDRERYLQEGDAISNLQEKEEKAADRRGLQKETWNEEKTMWEHFRDEPKVVE